MSDSTTLTIFIGRFSPFHNGHAEVLQAAMQSSDVVLVLVGSIDQALNPKNPWTFDDRCEMIQSWVAHKAYQMGTMTPVLIRGLRDFPYNDQLWISNVHKIINQTIDVLAVDRQKLTIKITGADRDASTFYLKCFPEFKLELADEDMAVSRCLTATSVREIFFGMKFNGNPISADQADLLLRAFCPITTIDLLSKYSKNPQYEEMKGEHVFNVMYREPYKDLPYEVIFHTVDACVIQTGYVLLVKRRSRPGKGLWALPGGFLNPKERLFDAAIRELREETRIKVPEAVLRGSMKFKEDFDFPDRSLRGRTVTKAFLFHLPDHVVDGQTVLPEVKGSDDAEKAMWVPLNEALSSPERFFEDHFFIIENLVGKL